IDWLSASTTRMGSTAGCSGVFSPAWGACGSSITCVAILFGLLTLDFVFVDDGRYRAPPAFAELASHPPATAHVHGILRAQHLRRQHDAELQRRAFFKFAVHKK